MDYINNYKEGENTDIHNMEKSENHYAEWKKSDIEEYMQYFFFFYIYITF